MMKEYLVVIVMIYMIDMIDLEKEKIQTLYIWDIKTYFKFQVVEIIVGS